MTKTPDLCQLTVPFTDVIARLGMYSEKTLDEFEIWLREELIRLNPKGFDHKLISAFAIALSEARMQDK